MTPLHLSQQCHHLRPVLWHVLLYCLTLSSLFVLSLYALVPRRVRSLPRDDATHVKWRSGVVLGVAALAIGIYPRLFCREGGGGEESGEDGPELPPWYRYLGFSWQPTQDIKIALHVLALYLGPLCCAWLKIYHNARILHWEGGKKNQRGAKHLRLLGPNYRLPPVPDLASLRRSLNFTWIQPTVQSFEHLRHDEDHRWKILRNLFIAPLAEEVVFRACLLPPLLASRASLSPTRASWIAPLFFGVAHVHHFVEQYRRLPARGRTRGAVSRLLAGAAVQWAYTTLFGAYVSHAFARTCSLGGVAVAHVACNYMGLPDLGFAGPTSDLYGYRWPISIAYLFGICLFVAGFDSALFPTESVLPSLLLRGV